MVPARDQPGIYGAFFIEEATFGRDGVVLGLSDELLAHSERNNRTSTSLSMYLRTP